MKRAIVLSAFIICCLGLHSQNECIYLKDGSLIHGFIAEQIPGKNIKIAADSAVIYKSGKGLIVTERAFAYDSLPDVWKKWSRDNNSIIEKNGVEFVNLSEIDDGKNKQLSKFMKMAV